MPALEQRRAEGVAPRSNRRRQGDGAFVIYGFERATGMPGEAGAKRTEDVVDVIYGVESRQCRLQVSASRYCR